MHLNIAFYVLLEMLLSGSSIFSLSEDYLPKNPSGVHLFTKLANFLKLQVICVLITASAKVLFMCPVLFIFLVNKQKQTNTRDIV